MAESEREAVRARFTVFVNLLDMRSKMVFVSVSSKKPMAASGDNAAPKPGMAVRDEQGNIVAVRFELPSDSEIVGPTHLEGCRCSRCCDERKKQATHARQTESETMRAFKPWICVALLAGALLMAALIYLIWNSMRPWV